MEKYILWIGVALLILGASVLFIYVYRRINENPDPYEDMEGQDFEYYCAEILRRRGVQGVEVTKGSGDFGIDILAEKDGVTYGIQCKCYDGPVGVHAVQEVYAGKDYYDLMVAVVMTNQYFTKSATEFAGKLNILLWDGDYVMNLIHEVAIPEKRSMMDFFGNLLKKNPEESAEDICQDEF